MNDMHSVLLETRDYVAGLQNLMAEAQNKRFNFLTVDQFAMLLRPIEERMEQALQTFEVTPEQR
jgi:hypothetical protein